MLPHTWGSTASGIKGGNKHKCEGVRKRWRVRTAMMLLYMSKEGEDPLLVVIKTHPPRVLGHRILPYWEDPALGPPRSWQPALPISGALVVITQWWQSRWWLWLKRWPINWASKPLVCGPLLCMACTSPKWVPMSLYIICIDTWLQIYYIHFKYI